MYSLRQHPHQGGVTATQYLEINIRIPHHCAINLKYHSRVVKQRFHSVAGAVEGFTMYESENEVPGAN
jgi:hypothetical protein